mmetsp:Transcript_5009/g.6623  ORF Transcript_5009/g.6623 Transcript_5009/m.6623 type:complete len:94 (+) Transcript_5009:81-362(+)
MSVCEKGTITMTPSFIYDEAGSIFGRLLPSCQYIFAVTASLLFMSLLTTVDIHYDRNYYFSVFYFLHHFPRLLLWYEFYCHSKFSFIFYDYFS